MNPRDFARLKRAFFSGSDVARFLDRKTRRVLSKFGAYVRRAAQTSMRDRKGAAPPGSPPYAHGRRLLRRLLFFSYDPAAKAVVVGPVRLGETADQHVPRLQEEGGRIARQTRSGKTVVRNYRPHPFMKPAFDKNVGWVAEEYRNA